MMHFARIMIVALCSLQLKFACAQSAQLTPVSDIGMVSVSVTVPPVFASGFPSGKTLNIPSGYKVSVYYAGTLNKPRFMKMSPEGVLHVADMGSGKILALPDMNNDGIADTVIEAANGFSGNHDVKFYNGSMYVAETTKIWKCTDANADGVYETKTVFIQNLGNNQTTGHTTRTMAFDSVNRKIYVSIGSSCNVCRESDRAIIEQYNIDGSGRRVYASGVRNAVGLMMHPHTNRLWANNNGSDQQGNEIPPEWIDLIRDNGFYGHPFAYGNGVWFDFNAHANYQGLLPITATDSSKVSTLQQPAALIRAHSAPMALEFLNPGFGASKQHGFITALRGSWNTTNPKDYRGYKVIYGHLSSPEDTTVDYVADFVSGFITDTVNQVFWGRPVGLAKDNNGKVYISSDEGNRFILVLTPDKPAGIEDKRLNQTSVDVFPNPVEDHINVSVIVKSTVSVKITVLDMFGKEAAVYGNQLNTGSHNIQIETAGMAPGIYILCVSDGNNTVTRKIIKPQ